MTLETQEVMPEIKVSLSLFLKSSLEHMFTDYRQGGRKAVGRERERDRNIDQLPPICTPTRE